MNFHNSTSPVTFLVVVVFLLATGCGNERILYAETEEIGTGGWESSDAIRFTFSTYDTTATYNLLLDVTHTADYAWQNLYVRITTEFPGDSVKQDILSLELSDRKGGWEGRCRGDKCHITIPLQTTVRFPYVGDYTLTFEQYMRVARVQGILALKLTIVRQ